MSNILFINIVIKNKNNTNNRWNEIQRREIKLLPRLDFFGYSRKCHHYFKSP